VTDRGVSPEDWRTLGDLLSRHHAVDAAYERAVTYGDRAKRSLLNAFPLSAERDGLVALTDYVLNRDR
jgi:geranylgeranyl pyrophosphate synthase